VAINNLLAYWLIVENTRWRTAKYFSRSVVK